MIILHIDTKLFDFENRNVDFSDVTNILKNEGLDFLTKVLESEKVLIVTAQSVKVISRVLQANNIQVKGIESLGELTKARFNGVNRLLMKRSLDIRYVYVIMDDEYLAKQAEEASASCMFVGERQKERVGPQVRELMATLSDIRVLKLTAYTVTEEDAKRLKYLCEEYHFCQSSLIYYVYSLSKEK